MTSHSHLYEAIRGLRSKGHTYSEINTKLGSNIPKSSMSHICKDIKLNREQKARISKMSKVMLRRYRQKAIMANRKILEDKINGYRVTNQNLAKFMRTRKAKLVALAILHLGEGAKWKSTRALQLGSTNPLIVNLYIDLLRECYAIPLSAFRGRIQHRADQNANKLVRFWSRATGIPAKSFYASYVDKRTIGKPTLRTAYKGVCVVSCAGTHVQLELEQIIDIISESLIASR